MSLTFVEPPENERTRMNALLYGPAKAGKSTGAASAPGPILYLNADTSTNALRLARQLHGGKGFDEVEMEGLDTLIDVTKEVKGGSKYETVVVDPVGDVYRILLESLTNKALNPRLDAYRDSGTHVERFCREFCKLDVNFVIVAQELAHEDATNEETERLPMTGTQKPALAQKLLQMVDIIGYCGVQIRENQEPRYVAQLRDGRGRRGGDRFNVLGTSRELDLAVWLADIINANAPQQAQKEAVAA